jgi:hypothetical protein
MPLLARNAIAFLIAMGIYAGGLRAGGYFFGSLDPQRGIGVFVLFHCVFGMVGYFLFRGNSRAVLVLFAVISVSAALNLVAPDPVDVADRRIGLASIVISISFGILAAIATNLTGWVVEQIENSRSGAIHDEAKETGSRSRRESTLPYRLGKWIGSRLHSARREK